jgi:hypothetical protein
MPALMRREIATKRNTTGNNEPCGTVTRNERNGIKRHSTWEVSGECEEVKCIEYVTCIGFYGLRRTLL